MRKLLVFLGILALLTLACSVTSSTATPAVMAVSPEPLATPRSISTTTDTKEIPVQGKLLYVALYPNVSVANCPPDVTQSAILTANSGQISILQSGDNIQWSSFATQANALDFVFRAVGEHWTIIGVSKCLGGLSVTSTATIVRPPDVPDLAIGTSIICDGGRIFSLDSGAAQTATMACVADGAEFTLTDGNWVTLKNDFTLFYNNQKFDNCKRNQNPPLTVECGAFLGTVQ